MIQRTRGLIIVHHLSSNFIDNRTVQSGGSLCIIDLGVRCHSFVNTRLDLREKREKKKKWSRMTEIVRFRRIYCLFWGKLPVSKSWEKLRVSSETRPISSNSIPFSRWDFEKFTQRFVPFLFFFFFVSINIYFIFFCFKQPLLGKKLNPWEYCSPFQ